MSTALSAEQLTGAKSRMTKGMLNDKVPGESGLLATGNGTKRKQRNKKNKPVAQDGAGAGASARTSSSAPVSSHIPTPSVDSTKSPRRDWSTVQCYNCEKFGHSSRRCPEPYNPNSRLRVQFMQQKQQANMTTAAAYVTQQRANPNPPVVSAPSSHTQTTSSMVAPYLSWATYANSNTAHMLCTTNTCKSLQPEYTALVSRASDARHWVLDSGCTGLFTSSVSVWIMSCHMTRMRG